MSDWQPTCELRIKWREAKIGEFKTKIHVHQQKWVKRYEIIDGFDDDRREIVEEEWRNIPHIPESET